MTVFARTIVYAAFAVALQPLTISAAPNPNNDQKICHDASGDVAIAACDRAIASGQFAGTVLVALYTARGFEHQQKGDHDRAIADYSEVIQLDPKSAEVYHGRGNAWYAKADYDRAIADYSETIRLNPKEALAYNNRGLAWHAKRDYDRAIADHDEAIRRNPKYALAYYNRGVSYEAKSDQARAIADYKMAFGFGFQPARERLLKLGVTP